MRIAMLSAHSCPVGNLGTRDTGGMSVYIREVARELGKRGHKVDVFTRVHDPRDPLMESMGRNARLIHLRAGGDEAINKLVLYSYLPDFACSLEDFRKTKNIHYDLIFSHYWLSGQVGREVCVWWGVPHVIMFHTLGAVKNTLGVGEEEPELRVQTEGELAQVCNRIITATDREKSALIKAYGISTGQIGVVPCGVNMRVFRPIDRTIALKQAGLHLNDDEKVVLFAGRIEPLKGIDLLIRAIAHLESEHKIRVLVVGGDEQNQDDIAGLKALSEQLGVKNEITFLGTIRHEKMPYFYNVADVCVVPSHYESFGLVALESLACGTPVVATDVGNLKNIIHYGQTGYVIKDHSPESLSEKIARVLAWPERTERKTRAIRNSILGYSWKNVADQIDTELQSVLANNLAFVR